MMCPRCGHPLIVIIYAICTVCRVAMLSHELQGEINEAITRDASTLDDD